MPGERPVQLPYPPQVSVASQVESVGTFIQASGRHRSSARPPGDTNSDGCGRQCDDPCGNALDDQVQATATKFKGWLSLDGLSSGRHGRGLLRGNALGHARRMPERSPPREPYRTDMHISVARWGEFSNERPHLMYRCSHRSQRQLCSDTALTCHDQAVADLSKIEDRLGAVMDLMGPVIGIILLVVGIERTSSPLPVEAFRAG